MPSSIPNKGVNDLATLHPEVAAEADGWDPSTVLAGSHSKMKWVCLEGHRWTTVIKDRTLGGNGCPSCAEYGLTLINLLGSICFNVRESSN